MKTLLLLVALVAAGCERAPQVKVASEEVRLMIDVSRLVDRLPLSALPSSKSDGGAIRRNWSIPGVEFGEFEAIGGNEKDAEQIGWQCVEFDSQGSEIRPPSANHPCRAFTRTVITALFEGAGDELAERLIRDSAPRGSKASISTNGLLLEASDGFYFVRRAVAP